MTLPRIRLEEDEDPREEAGGEEVFGKVTPLKTRYEVFFSGEVNRKNILDVTKILQDAHSDDEVILNITTSGGDLAALDLLEGLVGEIDNFTTVASGNCLSAGLYILMLGKTRKAYKYSTFMLHEASTSLGQDQISHHTSCIDILRTNTEARLHDFFGDYFSNEELSYIKSGKEFWFTAWEALNRGIIHEII